MTTITTTATTPANKPERVLYKTAKGHAVGDVIIRTKTHFEVVGFGETYGGTRYREMGRYKTSDRLIETFIVKASADQIADFEAKKSALKKSEAEKKASDRKRFETAERAIKKISLSKDIQDVSHFPSGRRLYWTCMSGQQTMTIILSDDGWLWEIIHHANDDNKPGKKFIYPAQCRRLRSTPELISAIDGCYARAA